MNLDGKTFLIETYGCQMNIYDSEIVSSILRSEGMIEVEDLAEANVIFLNTCAIREKAYQRVMNKISQHVFQYRTRGVLEITGMLGCVPQHKKEELKKDLRYVNIIAGPDSYRHLPEMIKNLYRTKKHKKIKDIVLDFEFNSNENYDSVIPIRKNVVSAYVTIMRGCNNFCTYCVVPYTRGRERSRSVDEIINEIKLTLKQGIKEIVLLGQNVNSYNYNDISFPELLQKIAEISGLKRLRFFTSHPKDLSDELIAVVAKNKNICNSIHLPFQSGSNNILKKMNRGYTIEKYLERMNKIKGNIPDVSLTTDIIVGFPSETEDDFEQTLSIIKEVEYDNSFMFIYSQREGTVAEKKFKDDVSLEIKSQRLGILASLQKKIGLKQLKKDIGKIRTVLIESVSKKNDNQFMGRTEQGRIVVFDKKDGINIGDFMEIEIIAAEGVTLFGKLA